MELRPHHGDWIAPSFRETVIIRSYLLDLLGTKRGTFFVRVEDWDIRNKGKIAVVLLYEKDNDLHVHACIKCIVSSYAIGRLLRMSREEVKVRLDKWITRILLMPITAEEVQGENPFGDQEAYEPGL